MKSKTILKVKEEVEKQLNFGFPIAIAYFDWVANIVLVTKKDGKLCMCIDYRDLNWASRRITFLCHISIP